MRSPAFLAPVILALAASALIGCTLPQQLLFSLIPDGTVPTLLSHFQTLSRSMQQKLLELEGKEDWPGMVNLADASLGKDPFSAEWWYVRGYALGKQARWTEAGDAFGRSVAIDPQAIDAWHLLAHAQQSAGDRRAALGTLRRSLDVARDVPATYVLMGTLHREERELGAARTAFREALRLAPRSAEALYGLGMTAAVDGRDAERDAIAERLRALDPALAERLLAAR